MRYPLFTIAIFYFGLLSSAFAKPPAVVVDIAPIHSLVSQVMQGVAQPTLLIPAEASPHRYALRPSEAKALADADVVFWVGETFTPWLKKALNNVATSAQKVEMLDIAGTQIYTYREGATFEGHDHHEEKDQHKKSHHQHHKEKQHTDHHDHSSRDPHAWLDPVNAQHWVKYIATLLAKKDAENAAMYRSNADITVAALEKLIATTQAKIDSIGQPQFIVFHDAYQYFEKRFDIAAAGAVALGDAEAPSPARIQEIRQTVKALGVSCVFTEPQYNEGLVKNVFNHSSVTTIGVMDPLGADIEEGQGHYAQLLSAMADSISQCR